ncbi:uncharacterized protein TRAVEDRAFT_29995 [Trametes versicolor FP-101664 SS1]|uniref:uncharacterized protein n=1 Tax=Trametes versicolor (strain FP-101664) TaxID=717944 RepID=UPI000462443E|nr:uncharacterized protein TRAVEDRAFT_29995 [Trametes versicolor FP-101664 SS1]EIW56431.1 hypothetical protein TRAVEDRAFT_29995 [Trametes versicolor FP-101664 SS1]
MSDSTNDTPLDPSSSPASPDPNSNGSDTNPTDPDLADPNLNNPDPNAGSPVDQAGDGTNTDPTSGATGDPTDTSAQDGSDAGNADGTLPPNGVSTPLPGIPPQTALPIPTPVTLGSSPSSTPNALPDNGSNGSDNQPHSLGGKSDDNTKTIIIASSVSGGVALILILLVIIFVYRRRNNKRRNAEFVDAVAQPQLKRGDSNATWIGPKTDSSSFDESKLEAGNRHSDASMESEATTLADFAAARAKSGAFSTPSHTPRPSLDKIKTQVEPMVPSDPFERPRLSIVEKPSTSLDQSAPHPVPAPRKRKSGAPTIRINSNSTFNGSVEIEQGYAMGPQSPGSPMLPLVTPIEPPAGWRPMSYMRAPSRRDSMVSLSRQSSRASSRNSQVFEPTDTQSPKSGIKGTFSALAKKRRSRADSIDPFRKSAATMMAAARRKSRAESIASSRHNGGAPGARRKSRAESIAPPTTPGGRRKSRAGSIAPPMTPRRRSQAAQRVESAVFASSPVEFIGLPKTPRTPTAAARRSRGAEPRTPVARTPHTPSAPRELPTPVPREPRTPATARTPRTPATSRGEPRTPRTPGGHPRRPSASVPRTPTSLDDAVAWSTVPLPPIPAEPRPLPQVPMSARAELRLSGLSRTLSEVSRESPI